MYQQKYVFYQASLFTDSDAISLTSKDLYNDQKGYGFVTDTNQLQLMSLQLPELNSGFEPYYWLKGQSILQLIDTPAGVSLLNGSSLPLIFKASVPKQGNYHIRITIRAIDKPLHDVMIFTGCRRLLARQEIIKEDESYILEATVNICDIIPRGKTTAHQNTSFNLAILADSPVISELSIQEADCPTIFIAGDSTLTDQNCAYPYNPGASYSGWAQMLPYYLQKGIAVSNHAHSGLTTESFRSEGHYDILKANCKPGDYFLMQFGHNDQKLPHLSATGGYAEKVREYINEMRALDLYPVLVTPLARNTWKGDGSYNDLLKDYADIIKAIGAEMDVPVLDLHDLSMAFVIKEGVSSASRYFYPKDYTHSNDYGAFLMAGYIMRCCLEKKLFVEYIKPDFQAFVKVHKQDSSPVCYPYEWIPPQEITLPKPPADYADTAAAIYTSNFTDIEDCEGKTSIITLGKLGVLSNSEEHFRPKDIIRRIELLDWIIKAVRFVPTNVYNDKYPDVIGHEWYAGVVEVVIQNEIVNDALTADGKFHPMDEVTAEQLVSFCMVSYRCRKVISGKVQPINFPSASTWANEDLAVAAHLGFIDSSFLPQKLITREEAAIYVKKLSDLI